MPDRPQGKVVANNTPLVALCLLGRFDLLNDLFGEVLIPESVHQEFLATDRAVRQRALDDAPWIHARGLKEPRRALAFAGLDRREADVLALAEERQARLVIIDERRGRRYARRMGFPLTRTLGILLLAKERGLVPWVAPLMNALREAGFYISEELVEEMLRMACET